MTRGDYYVAVDEENGRRSWLVDWGDGSWGLYDQDGETGLDELGQAQGTGFTLAEARERLPDASFQASFDGRPGVAKVFRLKDGKFAEVPRPAKRRRPRRVSLRRKVKTERGDDHA